MPLYNDKDKYIIQGADMMYEDFIFKHQQTIANRIIYDVYPKTYISQDAFVDKIIYNDKLLYHFSTLIGVAITNIRGYIIDGEDKSLYKMTIQLDTFPYSSLVNACSISKVSMLLDDFYAIYINDKPTATTLLIEHIQPPTNEDDEINIIDNSFLVTISLTNIPEDYIDSDDMQNFFNVEIPEKLNRIINPNGIDDIIGFEKLYYVTITKSDDFDGMIENNVNAVIEVLYKIDTFGKLKMEHLSDRAIIVEKDLSHKILASDIMRYFFYNDLKYRECNLIGTHGNYEEYMIQETLCTFGKNTTINKIPGINIENFTKTAWSKKDIGVNIYKNKNIFSNKFKYAGVVTDPKKNRPILENALKSHPIFKDRKIQTINTLDDVNYFVLIPK